MIQQIHQVGYIETIRNDVTESIQDLGRGSNIRRSLADVVSEKIVATNVENYVRGIYQEIPFELQGEIRLKRIFWLVPRNMQNKNIPIDEETQKCGESRKFGD